MPKLLHTLRTSSCADNKLLTVFNSSLRYGLTTILNIDLTDDQWTQAEHSSDWLHAQPITAVGLRLNDEIVRISIATRLAARACEPHTCLCGKEVDARGLHGLSCRKSAARHIRHAHLNDTIWRAVKRAHIPAVKEPFGLSRADGKRPDGATLIPWAGGKALAWDVTVADTFALSHVGDTSILAGAAANHAMSLKTSKYYNIAVTNIFVPVAIETGGAWDIEASEFIQELGKRITVCTKDPKETQYLFQQLSMAIQRGNVVSFLNTFSTD